MNTSILPELKLQCVCVVMMLLTLFSASMRFLGVLKPPVDPCGSTVRGAAGWFLSLRSVDLEDASGKICGVVDL